MILLLSCLSVEAVLIKAQVKDSRGRPLADVSITDGRNKAITDAHGNFSLTAQSDSLLVSRLGYRQRIVQVAAVPQAIILEKKEIVLQPVKVVERFAAPVSAALDKTVLSTDVEPLSASPAEVLLQESAFHSTGTLLTGENQALSLLGNLSRHTLVMLDNVPLNPNGEAFDLSSLPLENIKRMEIVKGNASVYGGSSAIGGVIYLFTDNVKTAHPLQLASGLAFGSFGQIRQNYSLEQMSPLLSYRVSLSRQAGDNDFSYEPRPWWNLSGDLKRNNNRKEQTELALQLDSSLGSLGWHYKLDAGQVYRQLPGPVNFLDIYTHAYLTGQNLRHNLSLDYQAQNLTDNLIFWLHDDNTEYNNTRAANPVYVKHYCQARTTGGVKNLAEYSLKPVTASFGLELSRQTYALDDLLSPAASIGKTSRDLTSGALQVKSENAVAFLTNQIQIGARLDDVSEFGTHTSWRLEELLKLDGEVEIQAGAAYGTGFSLPSFYDLYWKGDAQSLGNPNLKPETSQGGSFWTQATYQGNSIKLAYYASNIEDLIQWRQTYLFGTQWKPVNLGKAVISNWEISALAQPLPWLELKNSTTFTRARDKSLDAELTYTPQARSVTGLTLKHKGISLDLGLDYTGRQWSTPDNLIQPIPDLTLFNASVKYAAAWHKLSGSLSLQLNNLFDRQYEIYSYVPQPGFNWLSGLALQYEL